MLFQETYATTQRYVLSQARHTNSPPQVTLWQKDARYRVSTNCSHTCARISEREPFKARTVLDEVNNNNRVSVLPFLCLLRGGTVQYLGAQRTSTSRSSILHEPLMTSPCARASQRRLMTLAKMMNRGAFTLINSGSSSDRRLRFGCDGALRRNDVAVRVGHREWSLEVAPGHPLRTQSS